jgi:hypothetical protein
MQMVPDDCAVILKSGLEALDLEINRLRARLAEERARAERAEAEIRTLMLTGVPTTVDATPPPGWHSWADKCAALEAQVQALAGALGILLRACKAGAYTGRTSESVLQAEAALSLTPAAALDRARKVEGVVEAARKYVKADGTGGPNELGDTYDALVSALAALAASPAPEGT